MSGAPRPDADEDEADAVRALVAVGVPEVAARRCVAGQYDPAEDGAAPAGGDFAVLGCNWCAVRAFVAMATQWRYRAAGMASVPQGLDYGVVRDVLALLGIKKKRQPGVFEQLRVLEAAALEAMRARAPR